MTYLRVTACGISASMRPSPMLRQRSRRLPSNPRFPWPSRSRCRQLLHPRPQRPQQVLRQAWAAPEPAQVRRAAQGQAPDQVVESARAQEPEQGAAPALVLAEAQARTIRRLPHNSSCRRCPRLRRSVVITSSHTSTSMSAAMRSCSDSIRRAMADTTGSCAMCFSPCDSGRVRVRMGRPFEIPSTSSSSSRFRELSHHREHRDHREFLGRRSVALSSGGAGTSAVLFCGLNNRKAHQFPDPDAPARNVVFLWSLCSLW
jgi:hypothetical protein